MAIQYSKEELWAAYQKLPKEIKDVVFADETLDQIEKICKQNNVSEEEQITSVTKCIKNVLFGLLPPDEVQKSLEELNLDKKAAKKILQEISQVIFAPIKAILNKMYFEELKPGEEEFPPKKMPKRPSKKDVYREPVE